MPQDPVGAAGYMYVLQDHLAIRRRRTLALLEVFIYEAVLRRLIPIRKHLASRGSVAFATVDQ